MQFQTLTILLLAAAANAHLVRRADVTITTAASDARATATQGEALTATQLPVACPTNAAGISTGMTQCGGIGIDIKKCSCGKCTKVNEFFSYCAY